MLIQLPSKFFNFHLSFFRPPDVFNAVSLDWQYAELPLSASGAVLYIALVCKMWDM